MAEVELDGIIDLKTKIDKLESGDEWWNISQLKTSLGSPTMREVGDDMDVVRLITIGLK